MKLNRGMNMKDYGCGYWNSKMRSLSLIYLGKANEVGKGFSLIWKIELGEKFTEEEKDNLARILTKPGLDEITRKEYGTLAPQDPAPIGHVDTDRLFSGKYKRKEMTEVKEYLLRLSKQFVKMSDDIVGHRGCF